MQQFYRLIFLMLFFTSCTYEFDEKYRINNPYQDFKTVSDFQTTLQEISKIQNQKLRDSVVSILWDSLVANRSIPFVRDTNVVFIYRGSASTVHFTGDFSQWKILRDFEAKKLKSTNLWILSAAFPITARLDYKIVIDKTRWILDSANIYVQNTGFNSNSELRMPLWQPSAWGFPDTAVGKGNITEPRIFKSVNLGYDVSYFVYLPVNFLASNQSTIIYITDGQEYSDPKLGNVPTLLNNLIGHQMIKPTVAVFIDPRNPSNIEENRRRSEYSGNKNYIAFLADEFVAHVEKELNLTIAPENRAILGTSLGGWASLYAGLLRSEVFNLVAAQSPAIQEDLIRQYAKAEKLSLRFFISCGTFFDGAENTKLLRDVLIFKGYSIDFIEVQEGHSWGAWRNQIDAILKSFFPLPPAPKKPKK